MIYNQKELEEKLEKLRLEYKHSEGNKKKLLEIRGKLVRKQLDKLMKGRML